MRQDSTTSDVFHPDFVPGKNGKIMRRARARARAAGIPLDEAVRIEIEDARTKMLVTIVRHAEDAQHAREERELRRNVYPAPQSVRAIPTGFETSRRRH